MENVVLSLGQNLVSHNERMVPVTLADMYEHIVHAKPEFANQIEVLRSIRRMDSAKYSLMKKSLPYFVCAHFAPAIRRQDNFSSVSSFVLDIDNVDEDTLALTELKRQLGKDGRIAMMFTSPGGNGIKILFLLAKPCRDYNVYTAFYKQFASSFAKEYNIEPYIDMKTCDVARACFLSADPEAMLNISATPVDMDEYVDMDCVDMFVKEDTRVCVDLQVTEESRPAVKRNVEPDKETMARIKEQLEMNSRKKLPAETRPVYVPCEITDILTGLKRTIEETGIELYDTRNIQYGVKLMFRTGQLHAEINLFFGHRGYSVVESPKRGTSAELNGMMAQLVDDYIHGAYA